MKNELKLKLYKKLKEFGWLDHSDNIDWETAILDIMTFSIIPFSIFVLIVIMIFR